VPQLERPPQLERRRLFAAAVWLLTFGCAPVVRIHLVRHAEKERVAPPSRDPPLSALGARRARSLATLLDGVSLSACFATEFRRTQATVEPTARAHGLAVEVVPADDVKGLCARIWARAGQDVLVAGHSNTVPEIARELGALETITLGDDDYGDLFTLETGSWRTSLRRGRFDPA
jgi:broad specificity phosphatase PhoE